MATGTIDVRSVFGSFDKALLSGVDAGTLLQTVKVPEMLFVLHSMQVRNNFFYLVPEKCTQQMQNVVRSCIWPCLWLGDVY